MHETTVTQRERGKNQQPHIYPTLGFEELKFSNRAFWTMGKRQRAQEFNRVNHAMHEGPFICNC